MAHWNKHLEPNWKHAFQHAERHCSCGALGKLHSIVAAKCQTARSLTPVRHTIPNPHTSQLDPHVASGHILMVSLFTMQDWLQQFAPCSGEMCKDVYLGFPCLGHRRIWASSKTDFLVQNMRHEVLFSSRHRPGTMLSKAKHLTQTPSNAARRCAQGARQFVRQCRSHSEADDPPGGATVVPFLTLWAILNLTTRHYFVATSFTTFFFFRKTGFETESPRFCD